MTPKFIGKLLNKFIYQGRVDEDGQIVKPNWFHSVNQRLMEGGFSPPWVMSQRKCLSFWSQINNEEQFKGNRPQDYAAKSRGIIDFLHTFWQSNISKDDFILELGCNSGANLNWLRQLGYKHLSGIEINPLALEEMRCNFPELANMTMYQGSLENILPMFTSKVDIIFSMATLMHIHPASNFVFKEIVRVVSANSGDLSARRFIVTVECEVANCSYIFTRNYRRVFERLGCVQLKCHRFSKIDDSVDRAYDGYTARLFEAKIRRGEAEK